MVMYMKIAKIILAVVLSASAIELYSSDYSTTELTLATNIKASMATLSPEKPYAYFDLGISEGESEALRNLKITLSCEYASYGIEKDFEKDLTEFINKLGSFYDDCGIFREYETSLNANLAHATAQYITKIIRDVLLGSKQETALIKVRSFLPTHQFDTARWHVDKSMQASTHKFTIALKGPGTLFYDIPTDIKEQFFSVLEGEKDVSKARKQLATLLHDETRMSKPQSAQGAVFMINSKNGAIHSEPIIDEIRLLLAITPHSKAAFDTMLEKERRENEEKGIDYSGPNQIKINF